MAALKLTIYTSNLDSVSINALVQDLLALGRAKDQEVNNRRPIILPLSIENEEIVHNADGDTAATWEI